MTDDDEPVCTVPQMLSVPQVASRLSVSVRKVYMLVEAGDLTLVKLGRNSRISSADVNALLDRSRAQTEPTSAPNEAPDASGIAVATTGLGPIPISIDALPVLTIKQPLRLRFCGSAAWNAFAFVTLPLTTVDSEGSGTLLVTVA